MAIDTRDRRASAVCTAIGVGYPTADGTIDAADRAHVVRVYRGLTFGAPPAIEPYASFGCAWLYTAANYSGGAHYFEVYMRAASGTVYAKLYNDTDAADVADSEMSATASTKFQRIRTGALSLTDNKQYKALFARSTGGEAEALGAFSHYY